MNYENYDYLTETVLPRFGVGGTFDKKLEQEMSLPTLPSTIELRAATTFNENKMEYNFRLDYNEDKERYFLNSVDATITRKDGTSESQMFRLYNQSGLNIEQMHNVVEGRFAWREYMKWDSELQQSTKQSGWFFKDTNRLDDEGKPMIRVLNDDVSKFNLITALGDIPLNISQKEKNDLIRDLKQGNEVSPFIKLPNGNREKVSVVVHPQKGLQVFNSQGEKLRFRKVDNNVIAMDSGKVSEKTLQLIEKAKDQETGQAVDMNTGKGKGRKAS
ncbi:hypothetical protein [Paraflavitalea sp. CAU 1676]|uniref:hypothetical protein n=1 Tax=Paraflavitalea sp. CAU 1676 TaxID=3032598 RepID=UPI0023DC4E25|nr:hypothetical protein [Paraflavitalea sp. CAU 1676]MDF2190547.1 hypothetical protein [Paraflavitalea sp. CAU 1676]